MIFSGRSNTSKVRTWIVAILGLAFCARALIPPGYMPDFDALSRGVFKIVICHGGDVHASSPTDHRMAGMHHAHGDIQSHSDSADAAAHQHHDGDGQNHADGSFAHHPCAFSGLAAIALFAADAAAVEPIRIAFAVLKETPPEALPPIRAGPVLGSRGPPLMS